MKFRKGQSGNPKGRPKGIMDKRVALRALLEPHTPQLVATVVNKALEGDMAAARICMERLIPPIKAQDLPVKIGPLGETLAEQARALVAAAASGRITPDQAASLMSAIAAQARIVEADELARRVAALEEKLGTPVRP